MSDDPNENENSNDRPEETTVDKTLQGIPFEVLIGGPLQAIVDASVTLAQSTADYIQQVGFFQDRTDGLAVRMVDFKYEQPNQDEATGETFMEEIQISLPLISIVPIPNLKIDSFRTEFNLELTTTAQTDIDKDKEVEFHLYGKASSHKKDTRSTDKSAKYHMELVATDHGVPETLARVLDMMAAGIAPNSVVRKPKSIQEGTGSEG